MREPDSILEDGFNITQLANICKNDQIENCPFKTEGSEYEKCFINYQINKKIG